MNILLLGGSGQDAYYLSSSLIKYGASVDWLYRSSISRYQHLVTSERLNLSKISSYSFQEIKNNASLFSYDAIVLIAGAVGNKIARENPAHVYQANLKILFSVIDFIRSCECFPHLYFFSTSDVDGRTSSDPFLFSPTHGSFPNTSYGLSKKHSADILRLFCSSQDITHTVIHLGMHESFCRDGDYVLTKIKRLISNKLLGEKLEPQSFGNLNVLLDIGFARDYMNIIAGLITSGYRYTELTLGTGQYTHLRTLCESVLREFEISPDQYLFSNCTPSNPLYYPLVPPAFGCQDSDASSVFSLPIPGPLTGKMLKSEPIDFQIIR